MSLVGRSNCEQLAVSICLPLSLRTQTLLDEVGTSHLCHKRKWPDQFYYRHGRLPAVMAAGSATRGRSKSQVKKCAERCWQFANPYLMVIVIFSETTGGLNG